MKLKKAEKIIGHVGVDAGLMYLGDPCYVIDRPLGATPWNEFLDKYLKPENEMTWQVEYNGTGSKAVVVTTGWGDGLYPVIVEMKHGRVARVSIDFMV